MAGHTYSAEAIRLFLQFVLEAACSLRGASAVMGLLIGLIPKFTRHPVANTGQLWLLLLKRGPGLGVGLRGPLTLFFRVTPSRSTPRPTVLSPTRTRSLRCTSA